MQLDKKRPLCVDLDGTLIKSDVLWESLFQLLKQFPLSLFLLPFWVLKGKAQFKARIAARVDLDPSTLPYNRSFLRYLVEEKEAKRELILATASNERPAARIAEHLGIFDRVYASDERTNLSGKRKLRRLVQEYGEQGFDYAGNAPIDLEIWPHAAEGVLVNPSKGVHPAAKAIGKAQRLFEDRTLGISPYIRALRLRDWLKNLLVFLPLLLAQQVHDPMLIGQAALAFLAFSFCASSTYLFGDLLNLRTIRRNPLKYRRPLATGDLPIPVGVILMTVLLAAALVIGLFLPGMFLCLLSTYFAAKLGYSFRFEQTALMGVLMLAGLYSLRILAGSAAIGVETSSWLLAFSMFFFLSLALVKRFSELLFLLGNKQPGIDSSARGFEPEDLETLSQLGTASGYGAVLVLALYISSDQADRVYAYPEAFWLLCVLLLYWISHIWMAARRGGMPLDPVVFTIQDRRSPLLLLVALGAMWVAL